MSYVYEIEKTKLFTDGGQRMFLRIRDETHRLLKLSGAVMAEKLLIGSGDSWTMIACLDRLIELGEIVEVDQNKKVPGQYRIFIKSF